MMLEIVQKTGQGIRFYHPDHLGSTTVVTDLDGEVTQNVAYIPYGEVFVEQRNGTWNTPYLFNAKELDEETGLYYYGARYLDPTGTRWLSVDPLFEKYVGMTPYGYCAGNPVRLVDANGLDVVNGHEKEYENKKRIFELRESGMKSKYGNDFENRSKGSFSSKSEYKTYKKSLKTYNTSKKLYEGVKKHYDLVNKYIENYKKIDPEGFETINNLTYKDGEETIKYDVIIKIDNFLYEWGGARTSIIKKTLENGKTIYAGLISLSPTLTEGSDRLAHEFGHNVNNASDPIYWIEHTNNDLNCQENPADPQAKDAIKWQEEWKKKYERNKNR